MRWINGRIERAFRQKRFCWMNFSASLWYTHLIKSLKCDFEARIYGVPHSLFRA